MLTRTNPRRGRILIGASLALAAALLLAAGASGGSGAAAGAAQATPAVEEDDETEHPRRHRFGAAGHRCRTRLAVATAMQARLDTALTDLVADGTLTQAQADEVEARLTAPPTATPADEEGTPRREMRGRPCARIVGQHELVAAVAEIVGLSPEEIRTRLAGGESLAEIAESEGVTREELIAALAAEITERLDAAVAAGRLDAERRAELEAALLDRLDALVDRHVQRDSQGATEEASAPGSTDGDLAAATPTTTAATA